MKIQTLKDEHGTTLSVACHSPSFKLALNVEPTSGAAATYVASGADMRALARMAASRAIPRALRHHCRSLPT